MENRSYTKEQFESFKSLVKGQYRGFNENKNFPLHGIKTLFNTDDYPYSHQIVYDVMGVENISGVNDMISCFRKGQALDLYFESFIRELEKFEY